MVTMIRFRGLIAVGFAGFAVAITHSNAAALDYPKYVHLFLGTTNGGNMFPGVVPAPFSMVKLGPDVINFTTDAYSGYLPQGRIFGFSMMHESGTGGAPKYGVVSQMPVVAGVPNPLLDLGLNRTVPDVASLGYYRSKLVGNITVELAGTERAGCYQYRFPAKAGNAVVVDVSHVLSSFRGFGWGQGYAGGSFALTSNGYTGHGIYNNGWNLAPDWTVYFCGHFDQRISSAKTFTGDGTGTSAVLYSYGSSKTTSGIYRQGGVFTFDASTVTSRVGISFISTTQACSNVAAQIPAKTTLNSLIARAQTRWATDVFSKVTVSATNTTSLTQLYSYLYGMHLLPSNRTGENPLWKSTEPSYDDIFTFWDLFRCSTALLHVLQPKAYVEQLRNLVDIWRHEGWLPDGRSSNFNGRTQGGSNADNVLADAYVKGVQGVNWTAAYMAMVTDAEVVPVNNFDRIANDSSTKEGRGALPDWKALGYITPRFSRAVSKAVEYSANDFGLYQVASGLGLKADAERYLNRSRNWRNHWNARQKGVGEKGFLVPRFANGSFQEPYDPLSCGGCYWPDPFYQDLAYTYTFNPHHDIYHLIDLAGGASAFTSRLEKFFQPGIYAAGNAAFNHTIFNPGNEPAFTTPYLFNFVGRQDLSVKHSRHAAEAYYGTGVAGLPGNSDAGAMQTWILWSMIGLYPMTGQPWFFVGSPWFERMVVDLGEGRKLVVTSEGGKKGIYVQSLKVNGRKWYNAWVGWNDVFEKGGSLEFVLGEEPMRWANGTLPPSPAS